MKFTKYHALGNDYLVLDPVDAQLPGARDVVRICHRNFGIGSDGILFGPIESARADFGLRIINPDGSEAEKSGNGLRIFARYLHDCGKVGSDPFTIDTAGGVVTCRILDGGSRITVDMGKVRFGHQHIPVDGPEDIDREVGEQLVVDGRDFTVYVADIGNPHCVVPMREISKDIACQWGPLIEVHERFPNRTNIQFLEVIDPSTIRIEIWERGAGYTLASGSSSCAAAAVAHYIGLAGREITVKMPGGEIGIGISGNYEIRMSGPATRIGEVDLDAEALAFESAGEVAPATA